MEDNSYQINLLYGEIASLNSQIRQNNEKIERLERAYRNIGDKQDQYFDNKRYIHKPQLTGNLWRGKHAERFLERRDDIEDIYMRVGNQNIQNMLDRIKEEIERYSNINRNLNNSISNKRSRIEQLRN